jgi:hypothetical protein
MVSKFRGVDALSMDEVAEIMDAALGEPPETPPGCAAMLHGCLHKLTEE